MPIVDPLSEGNETVILTLAASSSYAIGASGNATVTIADGAAPLADIRVTKVVTSNPSPTVGEQVTFRVQANNLGPSAATGVVLQDLLPTGFQFASKNVFQGAYNESTGVWTVGALGVGITATLDVTATVLATGSW